MKMRASGLSVKFGLNNAIINTNKFKKKKKKSRGGNIIIISEPSSSTTTTTSTNNDNKSKSGIVLNEDFVIYEILTRLPVKSLFRFKSVCKLWCSIIGKNRNFIDLHLTRSKSRNPSLFIIAATTKPRPIRTRTAIFLPISPSKQTFMTADLIEGGRGGASINTTDSFNGRFNRILNPVNGLICFIDYGKGKGARFYNISTQQRSPWIKNFLKGTHGSRGISEYQFGFDPATNEHKLVCIRMLFGHDKIFYNVCEVLTILGNLVGEDNSNELNQWRRINEVPPHSVVNPSVYVNGTIYWSTCELAKGGEYWSKKHRPISVVAFDVGSEKFRTIHIPDFILDQPREQNEYANVDLLEVDGHVALQIKMSKYVIKLFILNDEKKENMTTCNHQNWTEMTINLPFCWTRDTFVRLHSVLDQIILITDSVEQEDKEGNLLNEFELKKKERSFSFHSYNWKMNIFRKLEIKGIPTQIFDIPLLTTFSESLLPIPNLSNIGNSSST